jgi:hypothetical protein
MTGPGGIRHPIAATYPIDRVKKAIAHAVKGDRILLSLTEQRVWPGHMEMSWRLQIAVSAGSAKVAVIRTGITVSFDERWGRARPLAP